DRNLRLLGGGGPGERQQARGGGQGAGEEGQGRRHEGVSGGENGHGFSTVPQAQGVWPHPGQPAPYFRAIASSRSTPAMFARVASQARTSANSSTRSSWDPPRSAADSSPTSSMNHMNVPSAPRRPSFSPYMSRMSCCNWPRVMDIGAGGGGRSWDCSTARGESPPGAGGLGHSMYSARSASGRFRKSHARR